MSFNEMDVLLFQRFFSEKSNSQQVLEMIQINFNKKIIETNTNNPKNNTVLYDLFHIITNCLNFEIQNKFALKNKFSTTINLEIYNKSLLSFENLKNDLVNKNIFSNTPYSYFITNKKCPIFNDPKKTEFFLHIILHYGYYLIFVHNNSDYKKHNNLLPPIFNKSKKNYSNIFPVHSKNNLLKISLLKNIINFFRRYHKKFPLILKSLNQASLEILIHLMVESYSFNKNNIKKYLFIFGGNCEKVFRTLMLFNEKNSNIGNYKEFTNKLLNFFTTSSVHNILVLIKIFNIKGLDENNALKIFIKIYTKDKLENYIEIKHLFIYLFEILLHCKKIKSKILTQFMSKALDEISFSYSLENELNNICIFESFSANFLQKFGIHFDFSRFSISMVKNTNKNNFCTYIDEKLSNFLYLLVNSFEMIVKRSFDSVFNYIEKIFLYIFDILNSFTTESKFYYLNLEKNNSIIRANIINYISKLCGYLDKEKIVKELYKYYFKPNIFLLKKKYNYLISYLPNNSSIQINIEKHNNFLNICSYLASNEYQTKVLNSIEVIFNDISPFNILEIQSAFLECYLNELNEINDSEKEIVLDLPKDLILAEEDENELRKNLDKISMNCLLYKEKIIKIILENLTNKFDKEELALKSSPTKIIYLIIKILSINVNSISTNNDILLDCFQCAFTLHQIGKIFFEYEDEIEYISLLKEIQQKINNNKEFSSLENKISELTSELLKNTKNTQSDPAINIQTPTENPKNTDINSLEQEIINTVNICKKTEMKKNKFELTFNLKKLFNLLDTSPNTNKTKNINMSVIQFLIQYLNNLLINKCYDDIFITQIVLKVYRNLFLSIKSEETLRKYYFKLISENLFLLLNKKNFISEKDKNSKIEATSKIFELFMKIIKKLKSKSYLISQDILSILFKVFENEQKNIYHLSPLSIVSCITICAYLIEYCYKEILQYISIIIRTGINFLKSNSSTVEQQRASAFLLYKILDKLSDEELDTYSKEIFDACNIVNGITNDKALLFYLKKCLDYYV